MYFGKMKGGAPTTVAKRQAAFRANCKSQGLVWDKDLVSCRPKKTAVRVPRVAGGPPTTAAKRQAAFRANCRSQGLVWDKDLVSCRPTKRTPAKPKMLKNKRPKMVGGAPTTAAKRQAAFRANCKSQGLVWDKDLVSCRPTKRTPAKPKAVKGPRKPRTTALSAAEKRAAVNRAVCRADKLVWDAKMKMCRDPKPRSKKAAFGLMYSTPSAWGHSKYYSASNFNSPDLLLGKAFQTVANRAAAKAVSQTAAKAVAMASKPAPKMPTKAKMSFR